MPRMPAATIRRPVRRRIRGGPISARPSKRFDVPEIWIRSVMRVESGGNEYLNGQLITSSAGAMGLMQVMPDTYDELRDRYSLGDDPFDPHENILAGTAYLREMYDIYGSPGFLAAYNAGPRRLDDYLSNNRALPDETRRYVAMIGPNIVGVYPVKPFAGRGLCDERAADRYPAGTRYGRAMQLASSRGGSGGRVPTRGPVQVAQLPEPPRPMAQPAPQQYALVTPPPAPPAASHWRLPPDPAGGGRTGAGAPWRFARPASGRSRSAPIRPRDWRMPRSAPRASGRGRNWRSRTRRSPACASRAACCIARRLTGLSRDAAVQACERLAHGRASCMVLSPNAQS